MTPPPNNAFILTLPQDVQDTLVDPPVVVAIAAGTDLYLPGDDIDWVYFPIGGLVSLISVMANGDEAETGVIGREGALGLVEALGSRRLVYRAVVQLDLTAIRIPAERFRSLFAGSEGLRQTVAAHVELNLAELRQSVACRSHHPVASRLAWWLLECQDRTGDETLALTQEFLAAMLGSQRTTLNAAAADLKSAGLIRYRRGVIDILDRPGLERRACECYTTVARFRQAIETPPGRRRLDRPD